MEVSVLTGMVQEVVEVPPHDLSPSIAKELGTSPIQEGTATFQVQSHDPIPSGTQEGIRVTTGPEGVLAPGLRLQDELAQTPPQEDDHHSGCKTQKHKNTGPISLPGEFSCQMLLTLQHLLCKDRPQRCGCRKDLFVDGSLAGKGVQELPGGGYRGTAVQGRIPPQHLLMAHTPGEGEDLQIGHALPGR
jgi:hypothetical protein